ncbi:MAG: hypothetical protein FWE35_19200 [Streptosporangiales bacterium]|nr:hypothetical protein [Streptosporangiales bacterium]
MTLILDSGALLALERGDKAMWARLKSAALSKSLPVSHGGVVGQVWRDGGPRQAQLAKAFKSVRIHALDDDLGLKAGALLAKTGTKDVIDAALVLLAKDGDEIATSDLGDIAVLSGHAELHVDIVPA